METISTSPLLTINGKKIYQFKLTNRNNTTVSIINYGAIISSFTVRGANGSDNDVVLGFHDPAEYISDNYLRTYPYFGAAVGRYGNRIKNGKIKIDGQEYRLTTNMGPDHLHGGKEGFDRKVWDVISFDDKE